MKPTYKFRYTLQNCSGTNDSHITGRVKADSATEAITKAINIWPFNEPVLDITLDYLGTVEELLSKSVPPIQLK